MWSINNAEKRYYWGIFSKSNMRICGSLNFLWFAESSGKVLEGCKSPARVNPLQACASVFTAVHQWFDEWFLFFGMFFMSWSWLHTLFCLFFGYCFWVCAAAAVERCFPLKLRRENACILVFLFSSSPLVMSSAQENINNRIIKMESNVPECSACLRELFCVRQRAATISVRFSRVIGDDRSSDQYAAA